MNPAICALTLVLSCGSKPAVAVNLTHAVTAFGDTYTTQHFLRQVCPRYGWNCWESNPLQKPFQEHGQVIAYTSAYLEASGHAYLSARLRKSESKTWRTVGRVLQFVQIGAHGSGIQSNISLMNRMKGKWNVQNNAATQSPALPVLQGGPVIANGS